MSVHYNRNPRRTGRGRVPKFRVTILGVPIRSIVFGGIYITVPLFLETATSRFHRLQRSALKKVLHSIHAWDSFDRSCFRPQVAYTLEEPFFESKCPLVA